MFEIKPKKVSVNFLFNCPKCGHDIYMSGKEAKFIGKVICEFCESRLCVKPINKISTKIHYKIPTNNVRKKSHIAGRPNGPQSKSHFDDVIDGLVNLGYKRTEAARMIDRAAFILGPNAAPDDLIKRAISG